MASGGVALCGRLDDLGSVDVCAELMRELLDGRREGQRASPFYSAKLC